MPFFVGGYGAALVEGVGERVRQLPAPVPPAGVLLVTPATRLATATVFDAFDRLPRASISATDAVERLARAMGAGLTGEALATLAAGLRDANDLWPAAVSVLPTLVDAARRPRGGARPARPDDRLRLDPPRPLSFSGSGREAATVLSRSGLASLADARIIATRTHGEATA